MLFPSGRVSLVTDGALSAARVRWYGETPPEIESLTGSHVDKSDVTLEVTVNVGDVDGVMMQLELVPASIIASDIATW